MLDDMLAKQFRDSHRWWSMPRRHFWCRPKAKLSRVLSNFQAAVPKGLPSRILRDLPVFQQAMT